MLDHFAYVDSLRIYDACAVEGAILVESGGWKLFDELWVVTLDKKIAYNRVRLRNPNMPDDEI